MAHTFIRCLPALMLAMALPLAAQPADVDGAVSKQAGIASAHAGMALGAHEVANGDNDLLDLLGKLARGREDEGLA